MQNLADVLPLRAKHAPLESVGVVLHRAALLECPPVKGK